MPLAKPLPDMNDATSAAEPFAAARGLGGLLAARHELREKETDKMKLKLFSTTAALLFTASVGAGFAQTVVVEPQQQTIIREYVQKQPLASVQLPGVELNIGSTVPATVELYEIPQTEYQYVVVENRTVVVDPQTRQIIQVID